MRYLVCGVLALAGASLPVAVMAGLPELPPVTQVKAPVEKAGFDRYKTPVIVVDGHGGGYDTVVTKQLDFFFILKGRKPKTGQRATGKIFVENHYADVDNVLAHEVHKITTPVMDLRAWRAVNERVSPIKLCNDELSYQKGSARKKFLKNGGTILRHSAYEVRASAKWLLKENRVGRFDPTYYRTFDSPKIMTTVYVKCNPIGNKAKKATETSTTRVDMGAVMEKQARKKPIGAKILSTPKRFLAAGNFLCPARLRLESQIKGRREFTGDVYFSVKGWKSKKTPIKLNAFSRTGAVASYPLQWQLGGRKNKTKRLTVKLHVLNQRNVEKQVIEKKVTIKCRKP